jgi:signal transduction histidine kinase
MQSLFRSPQVRVAVAVALVLVVGVLDYLTGYQISLSLFYLLPITFALWTVGTPFAVVVALLSIAIALLTDWAAGITYPNRFIPVWNAFIILGFYFVVIWLLSRLKTFQQTLEDRIRRRTAALADEIAKRHELEKEILIISEREQQRIGHEIHDTLCQHLTATAIAGQVLGEKLHAESLPEVGDATQIVELIEQGIEIARKLARGLFPVEIDSEGLISALRELAAGNDGRGGIVCRFESEDPPLIPDSFIAAHLYRIAQEAVRNAVQHSGARRIVVSLTDEGSDAARLAVRDDGHGIGTPDRVKKGMGLHIMRHRAGMIDASFEIQTHSSGTVVSCVVKTHHAAGDHSGAPESDEMPLL